MLGDLVMMKWIFLAVLVLHTVIHTLGFFKAFQLAEINQLTQTISKSAGIFWLIAFLFLLVSAIQIASNSQTWWTAAIIGVVISQVLIIIFWHDAKFGTIPNVIILLVAIVSFANWNFSRVVNNEVREMFSKNPSTITRKLTEDMIKNLPMPIQSWLKNSGAIGKEMIYSVRLKQKGEMKLKPEQESWYNTKAEQYFTVNNPAFIWKTKVDMMPFVFFTGRDYFREGKGQMLIKVLSLFNIVNAADEKINQGTLQRYMAEIIWFPTAAASDYIMWEEIDSMSAKATINYNGSVGSGIFHFNNNGDFVKFNTMRYMGSGSDAVLKEWIINVKGSEHVNGIKIPTKLEVSWKLDSGDFTWFKLEVFDVEYNTPHLFY